MKIDVIVCNGETQIPGTTEVPDNFFVTPTPEPTTEEKLQAQIDYLAMMTGVDIV